MMTEIIVAFGLTEVEHGLFFFFFAVTNKNQSNENQCERVNTHYE